MASAGVKSKQLRQAVAALLVFSAALLSLVIACDDDGGDQDRPLPTPEMSSSPVETVVAASSAICSAAHEEVGAVVSADLIEISGLVSSRRNDGVHWAHNDSGDTARVFAIGPSGEDLGTYTLADTEAIDWEDMAIGPGPEEGVDYLYLADIGDNDAVRPEIVVYRAQEPQLDGEGTPAVDELTDVEQITLQYPDRPHDAETLLIDPVSGDLLIVTKELTQPPSLVFHATAADLQSGSTTTLEPVGEIDFAAFESKVEVPPDAPPLVAGVPHLPTGGDVSSDGALVAIRTYGTVWVWDRLDGTPLSQAFGGEPCEAPSAIEPQGEAIAFDADGAGYITMSEGGVVPIHHFAAQ